MYNTSIYVCISSRRGIKILGRVSGYFIKTKFSGTDNRFLTRLYAPAKDHKMLAITYEEDIPGSNIKRYGVAFFNESSTWNPNDYRLGCIPARESIKSNDPVNMSCWMTLGYATDFKTKEQADQYVLNYMDIRNISTEKDSKFSNITEEELAPLIKHNTLIKHPRINYEKQLSNDQIELALEIEKVRQKDTYDFADSQRYAPMTSLATIQQSIIYKSIYDGLKTAIRFNNDWDSYRGWFSLKDPLRPKKTSVEIEFRSNTKYFGDSLDNIRAEKKSIKNVYNDWDDRE